MNQPPVVPSPPGHFALGHLMPMLRVGILPSYLEWRETYGDILKLSAPRGNDWYLLTHPDQVEQVLLGSYRIFHKGTLLNRVRRVLGNGLFTNEDELWREHRRAVQPVFRTNRHPDFARIMSGAVAEMVERWRVLAKEGKTFDILDEMSRVTIQNAGLTMFSEDFALLYDRMGNDLRFIVQKMNVFNFWKSRTADPRLYLALGKLHSLIDDLIAKRRSAMENDEEVPDDLLSALLRGRDSKTGEPFSNDELHNEILTFIFVGHETTALSLAWTWVLLKQNPQWLEKAQAEVDAVLNGRPPTMSDIESLPVVKNSFLESLRLYPPIWGIPRTTMQPVEISGFPIPKGATLVTVPYITHRHPDFWPDAERFDPDRFDPANSAGRPRFAYFPFGGGPRLCVAQGFATLEAQLLLVAILQNFHVELLDGQQFDLELWVTLRPKNGIKVRIQSR